EQGDQGPHVRVVELADQPVFEEFVIGAQLDIAQRVGQGLFPVAPVDVGTLRDLVQRLDSHVLARPHDPNLANTASRPPSVSRPACFHIASNRPARSRSRSSPKTRSAFSATSTRVFTRTPLNRRFL